MTTQLPQRQLGKNGPKVDALGLGLMGLSAFYGNKKPDNERLAFLDKAYELGARNWDSADMYADSEDLLGKWFKGNPDKRDNIFLATKFANRLHPDGSRSVDSSPEYCKQAMASSLKRLGLNSVDLYYCHRLDGKTPVEKTVEALVELKKEGKCKYIGLSECSAESLRRACKIHHIDAVQIEYSPFALDIESPQIGLLKACRELGVATVAYSPLCRGIISGTLRSPDDFEEGDFRTFAPRFSKENFPKNLELVDELAKIAKEKGCTPSQLTLAWEMTQGDDIIPIPGTTKIHRLEENMGACKIQLTEDEKQRIRKTAENAEVKGQRYPESFMAACFADTPPLN